MNGGVDATWMMMLVKVTELLKAIMDAMVQGGVRCEGGGESVCVRGVACHAAGQNN